MESTASTSVSKNSLRNNEIATRARQMQDYKWVKGSLPFPEPDVYNAGTGQMAPQEEHRYSVRPPPENRLLIRLPVSTNPIRDTARERGLAMGAERGAKHLYRMFRTMRYWVLEFQT